MECSEQSTEVARLSMENAVLKEELFRAQEDLEIKTLEHRAMVEKVAGFRRGRSYRKKKIIRLEQKVRALEGKLAELELEGQTDVPH